MTLPFYRNPDLADGFGATAGRSQPHRGLDFPHATGTPIPSVNAGVVVVSEWSSVLGWVVEVRGDDGVYLGYCHMNTQGLAAGTRVAVGSIIGPVGNTGSASFGSHLHITKGDRQGAVFGASMSYLSDPWPYIQKEQEEDDMFTAEDRDLLNSVKRALFDISIDDFQNRPNGIGREILKLRDTQFKETPTGFGTPGGTLKSLAKVLEQQAAIMTHLGIDQ